QSDFNHARSSACFTKPLSLANAWKYSGSLPVLDLMLSMYALYVIALRSLLSRVAEARSTLISSLARPFHVRGGSTSLTLAASRRAPPCVAFPRLARSVLGGPLNPGFPGRDHDAFRTEALCDPVRALRPALGEVVDPL